MSCIIRPLLVLVFLIFGQLAFAQTKADEATAQQLFRNGEYDKSLIIYQKLYKGKNGEAYFEPYFNNLLKLKRYDEAEKIIGKNYKNKPDYALALAELFLEQGNKEKANKAFDAVLASLPADEFAISGIANSFYAREDYEYAIKTLLAGRKVVKDDRAFSYELINLYRFTRQKDALVNELLAVLSEQPAFLANAKNNLARTFDSAQDYDSLKSLLLKKIQKEPDNTAFINLLAWNYTQQKQYDLALLQLIALDRRTNDNGANIYNFANTLIDEQAYPAALKALEYLLGKAPNSPYYIAAKVASLKLKNQQVLAGKFNNTDLQQLAKDYQDLLNTYGENNQTAFAIKALAHLQAFYLKQPQQAIQLLERAIKITNINASINAQLKLDLANLYVTENQPWEAALLYGQVEKAFPDHPIGQDAKFKNARLSFFSGDFNWAKAQLDVLKASTSQLIANDALDLSLLIQDELAVDSNGHALKIYARALLLNQKKAQEKALQTLDTLLTSYPQSTLFDDVLMLKADIFVENKNLLQAKQSLESIISRYHESIWADDALFKLAVLEEDELKDLASAKKHYQQLIDDFPGSLFLAEARKRFRNLRGDAL